MPTENDCELTKLIFETMRSVMKYTLDLEEYSYKDSGRDDPRYKFFKKQLMEYTYNAMRHLFAKLEMMNLCEPTDPPEDVKNGHQETPSGGSGYLNTAAFNKWLEKSNR